MLDAWLPGGTERPVCAVRPLPLDHMELLQEQGSREEPARTSVATGFGREACSGQRRLRSCRGRKTRDPEYVGRGSAAEGGTLSLSKSVPASDPVDVRRAAATEDLPIAPYA